jgi:hypothetical protein
MKTSHLKPGQRVVITSRSNSRPPHHGVFLGREGRMAVFNIDEFVRQRSADDEGKTTYQLSNRDFVVTPEEKR